MIEQKEKLKDLLTFVNEMVRLNVKPAMTFADYGSGFVYHEADVAKLPGLRLPASAGDSEWVSLNRQSKRVPPKAVEKVAILEEITTTLSEWLELLDDPDKIPELNAKAVIRLSDRDAGRLVAAGIVTSEAIGEPKKGDDKCPVVMAANAIPGLVAARTSYLDKWWRPWSEAENPVRRAIKFYERLFTLYQAINANDQPIDVLLGYGVARWKHPKGLIDRAILEFPLTIEIDEKTARIDIRPKNVEPLLGLDAFDAVGIQTTADVRESTKRMLETLPESLSPSPFQPETVRGVLEAARTHLAQGAELVELPIENRSVPSETATLRIYDTWVIFARPRSNHVVIQDIQKLIGKIDAAESLSAIARRVVTTPARAKDDDTSFDDFINRGDSGSGGAAGTKETGTSAGRSILYFPKLYNREQETIAHKLRRNDCDGMVVQGPPGTGKSHTIANIICDAMANGKRVLVTAHSDGPLQVLKELLPASLQDLAVNLSFGDRSGEQQLEKSITRISQIANNLDLTRAATDRDNEEATLLHERGELEAIDEKLLEWARKNLERRDIGGRSLTAGEIAEAINADAKEHDWFPDQIAENHPEPPITEIEAARIRMLRRELGARLDALGYMLPPSSALPTPETFGEWHDALKRSEDLDAKIAAMRLPSFAAVPNVVGLARALKADVDQIGGELAHIEKTPWLKSWVSYCQSPQDGDWTLVAESLASIRSALSGRKPFMLRPVGLGSIDAAPTGIGNVSPSLRSALERAAKGISPFGIMGILTARDTKQQFTAITIEGKPLRNAEEYQHVVAYVSWRDEFERTLVRWQGLSGEVGIPPLPTSIQAAAPALERIVQQLHALHALVQLRIPKAIVEGETIIPGWIARSTLLGGSAATLSEGISLRLAQAELSHATNGKAQLMAALKASTSPAASDLSIIVDKCGGSERRDSVVADWTTATRQIEVERSNHGRALELFTIAQKIAAQAPLWARKLLSEPMEQADSLGDIADPLVPSAFAAAWRWAWLKSVLRNLDGREAIQALSKKRTELLQLTQHRMISIVRLRTEMGLKIRAAHVLPHLVMFQQVMARMPRTTTGVRAPRLRKEAQALMAKCSSAIPCWVMNSWKVSETLPAELADFDLVIVDEASQVGFEALPAILRGKKLLIVGDDKQVTPEGNFVEEAKFLQLRYNYLRGQAYESVIAPGFSIYDLGRAMFAADLVMLREHFRCVEPIIRFSMQFYKTAAGEGLSPLRVPKSSERLDPPLIDVYVPHGVRTLGKRNPAEANAIVSEISRLVSDKNYAGRSIGVISLIGSEQAALIETLLQEKIGADKFAEHKIVCGDSATFQGKERDIVFLSLVTSPGVKSAALTADRYKQRFNVAMSRARDRLYLFRSMTDSNLRDDDLRAQVIRHFRDPMAGGNATVSPDVFQSRFEKDVYDRLVVLGYAVTAQLPVSGYFIDLVIYGADDRRLAVELDGDYFHPPEKWREDMARQRQLERMGWTFWRCWWSSWQLEPGRCIADLLQTLDALGIKPNAAAAPPKTYTAHKIATDDGTLTDAIVVLGAEPAVPATAAEVSAEAVVDLFPSGEDDPRQRPGYDKEPELTAADSRQDETVQCGDRVFYSFTDRSAVHTVEISSTNHLPDQGVVMKDRPIAKALIGTEVDQEIEVEFEGRRRTVVVLRIERLNGAHGAASVPSPLRSRPIQTDLNFDGA